MGVGEKQEQERVCARENVWNGRVREIVYAPMSKVYNLNAVHFHKSHNK